MKEGINVKITSVDTEINVVANALEYKFDNINDNGFDKTNKYLIKVKIMGDITEDSKAETLKFLEWSLDTSSKNVYRNVEIIILRSGEERRRVYELDGAFIVDYVETFDADDDGSGSGDNGKYTVNLIQRKENTNKEKVRFHLE